MSKPPLLASGTSNDAEERKVDNIPVGPETQVVGLSTGDSATSPPTTESSDSPASGKIVDVVSSTAELPPLTSDDLAAREMGNAGNKAKKPELYVEPSTGVKQVHVARNDETSKCSSDSESVSSRPTSNGVEVGDETLTQVDQGTTDNGFTDVTLPGNPGIPDAPSDVTTSGIGRREVETELVSCSPPLTVLLDGATTASSGTDRTELPDDGLSNVGEASVSPTENVPQLNDGSTNIRHEIEEAETGSGDANSGRDCSQDVDLDSSSLPNKELSASVHDK